MLVRPAVTDLLEKVDNRYSLIIMTAKRARELASGEPKLVETDDKSPVSIAVDEIFADEVYRVDEDEENKE